MQNKLCFAAWGWSFLLVVCSILVTPACDNNASKDVDPDKDDQPFKILDYGDASWDKPPLNPPGGEGNPNDPNNTDDGYFVDGDSTIDGDSLADGDSPSDGDLPQDGDFDYEAVECEMVVPCEELAWCSNDQTLEICSIVPDPEHPECMVQVIDEVICEEQEECVEPDGDADFSPDCYPVNGDSEALAREKDANICPESLEPTVIYMSNDDSNSMASPILCRAKILEGSYILPNDVRIYEFLNYYDLSQDNPKSWPAKVSMQMRRTNADSGEFTLLLSAQGRYVSPENRRPLNLVFSVDTSGSMGGASINRVRDIFRASASVLDEGDVVSVVEWSSVQSIPLDSHHIQGPNDQTLLNLAANFGTGGSTDLHAGLVRAYQIAQENYSPDRINRVIMISDGGANTGITDIDLIAEAAADENGEGIYLVGIGVQEYHAYYNDDLMNRVTDAGKGAYLYIDTKEEADRIFGDPARFLSVVEVAARDVRMKLTMPWYFGIKEFHGEEYSEDPEEVKPQHLAPNDAMNYHQIIKACDPEYISANDSIKAKVTFKDPISRIEMTNELELAIGEIVQNSADQLYKGDVIVGYAQSLIVIGSLIGAGDYEGAYEISVGMTEWLQDAASDLDDSEISEMADIMGQYSQRLQIQ